MDYPVPTAPSQPRWPTTTLGAQMLVAALLLELLLAAGASAVFQAFRLTLDARPGWLAMLGPGVQVAMALLGVVELIALVLLGRDSAGTRGTARAALVLVAADLGLSVVTEVVVWLRSFQVVAFLGPVSLLVGLAAGGLMVEALLRVRREASGADLRPQAGAVRGIYWSLAVLRGLLGVSTGFLLHLGSVVLWAHFGVRLALTFGLAGLVFWLGQSVFDALRNPRTVEDGGGLPLGPEGELDAELGRAVAGRGLRTVLVGAVWAVIGIGVTVWSYGSARQGGGRYVVAWGAIVVGVVMIVRGLMQLGRRV